MRHSFTGSLRPQINALRREFLQEGELPFADVLSSGCLTEALSEIRRPWKDRIFTPLVTLWAFLGQVLDALGHWDDPRLADLVLSHRKQDGAGPAQVSLEIELASELEGLLLFEVLDAVPSLQTTWSCDEALPAEPWPDLQSRFSRRNSDFMSEACWKRSSRSFSSARLMTSSSFGGRSGLSRTGATGARFRMASKITPEVSPRNGIAPVAISYMTIPKEKRSVRASRSLPRTCSGDI